MPSPQLVTTQSKPKALARSLVVSVLPVPAGPAGAPPRYMDSACQSQTQNTLSDSCKEMGIDTQVGAVTTHALEVVRDKFTLTFSNSAILDISVSPLTSTDPRGPSHGVRCIGD